MWGAGLTVLMTLELSSFKEQERRRRSFMESKAKTELVLNRNVAKMTHSISYPRSSS